MQKTKLLLAFNKLEASRQALLKKVEACDENIRNYKPAPEKWSVTQICYHLHLSEIQSIRYVKKKMLGGVALKKTGIAADVRYSVLKLTLLSNYKFKAPKILGDVPENLHYQEVITNWNETRRQLQSLVETIPDDLIDREVYRHPRAGRLNLTQMVTFFQDHFDHHASQVKRLIKAGQQMTRVTPSP